MNTKKGDINYSRSILISAIVISLLLISINYFTIKVLSSIRAYAHGESYYSKGQKDATRNLLLLIETKDTTLYQNFIKEISIPIGDSIARVALTGEVDVESARQGFLQGRNHPDDINNLIWLFVKFHHYEFMKKPIHIWKTADQTIGKTATLGKIVYEKILADDLNPEEEKYFIDKAVENTNESTVQERLFLDELGKISRTINKILFTCNFILTGLLLGGIALYNWSVVKRISKQKEDLNRVNKQLDEFLYSATHDLRAPISSLKGLVHISKLSKDNNEIQQYMEMMSEVLERQEEFILQIMEVSKNDKTDASYTNTNFKTMVEKALSYHAHMPQAAGIDFKTDYKAETLRTDPLRMEIILNNLLSNAIKYSDHTKESPFIKISSYSADHKFIFEIEDNGIGIDSSHLEHIFDVFYVANLDKKGSGIGLYLIQETVRKIGGEVSVESVLYKGSKFTIKLPLE